MAEDPSRADEELARLRAKADDQGREIARLHDEASEASGEIAQLGVEANGTRTRALARVLVSRESDSGHSLAATIELCATACGSHGVVWLSRVHGAQRHAEAVRERRERSLASGHCPVLENLDFSV